MRVAAAAWELRAVADEEGFFEHLREVVRSAARERVHLLVLPELIVLELLSFRAEVAEADVPRALSAYAERFESEITSLSAEFFMHVVGGSFFRAHSSGVSNVSLSVGHAASAFHPKNRLTRYERGTWHLAAGETLSLTPDPRVGVAICYDLEFPECGRALAEAGATVICAPSYTETEHGFHRVRHAAHARALENQVFVLHASLVGSLGREPVVSTFGTAAVIAPAHEPFPAKGVLAETALNAEGLAIADLDFAGLERCRSEGAVLNWADRGGEWRVLGSPG